MKIMTTALAFALAATASNAAIVTKDVDYEHGGVKLRGFLAYDDAKTKDGKLPGVLVVHEWWGLNDYVKGRAVQLAKLGYVSFALDMYGAGVDPKTTRLADVMTRDVHTIPPETSVEQTMTLFADRRCRHIPVVDHGVLKGLVSIGDISRWMADSSRAEAEHLKNYITGGFPT